MSEEGGAPAAPIRVSYSWTADAYLASFRLFMRSSATARVFQLFAYVFSAFLLYLAFRVATDPLQATAQRVVYPLLFLFLGLAVLGVRGPLQGFLIRRRFSRRSDAGFSMDFELGEEGLQASTEGLASSEFTWDEIGRAVVAPEGVLLFLTPRQYLYLPADGFESEAERERLAALLARRVPLTRTLT